jgi:putative alpha-1,2-mannosidase
VEHLAVMRVNLIPALFLWLSVTLTCAGQQVSDLVHPLVGTSAEGQTFPVAGVPFAMTDWTPQTRDGETKCVAPYYFEDKRIQGFRASHFLSGSCTQDYGSFTLMPVSGKLKLEAEARASAFTHSEETAHPYQYSVRLSDYDIRADMTGTLRCGILRFQYNRPGAAWLVLQSNRFVSMQKTMKFPARTVSIGSMPGTVKLPASRATSSFSSTAWFNQAGFGARHRARRTPAKRTEETCI